MWVVFLINDMKKRILFLIGNLESGGVSKSMVSLLNTIDRQKYEISLWMGSPTGVFYDLIPKDVIQLSDERIYFLLKGPCGLVALLRNRYFFLLFGNLMRLMLACFNKGYAGWILSKLIPIIIDKEYDLIVDYNGQHQLYYMIDKLKGKKKISFFHSDYSKWPFYYEIDKRYYFKVDYVFTISETCARSLRSYFPEQAHKIQLMENIISPPLIWKMSEENVLDIDIKNEENMFLTIGHVSKTKGSDMALKSAFHLKKKGYAFKWFFIGKVFDNDRYMKLVMQYDLQDNIIFLGVKQNPYPYLKRTDLYIHPSQFEGKSIALDEAKILCKPIVVTNFSTVRDQFKDRVNASICEMTSEDLSDAIEELLINENLRLSYETFLSEHIIDNSDEIEKLYKIIES